MIKGYEKMVIVDINLKPVFYIEMNYNDSEEVKDCKILKITDLSKNSFYIKKEGLLAFLFAIGNEAEQRQMIPQKLTRVKWYETVVSVKAKNDIRKGENITFPIKITLPSVEEEVVREIKRENEFGLLTAKSKPL